MTTIPAPTIFIWYDKEERFLKNLCKVSNELSDTYLILYKASHKTQMRLRLPAIILSSLSGVASFGTQSFPNNLQKYVSIVVGLINVCIAMIQTYESFIKIADIVSRALVVSTGLKKLADDIKCELSIPIENRAANGITFLRDCFSRYQAIVYQAPPLEFDDEEDKPSELAHTKTKRLMNNIESHMNKKEKPARYEYNHSDDDGEYGDDNTGDVSINVNTSTNSTPSPIRGLQPITRLRSLLQNANGSQTQY